MKSVYLEGMIDGAIALISKERRVEMGRKSLNYFRIDRNLAKKYDRGTWTSIGLAITSAVSGLEGVLYYIKSIPN